jgi:hypothetical protein
VYRVELYLMMIDDSKQVSTFPRREGGRFQVTSDLGVTETPSPFTNERVVPPAAVSVPST